MGKYATNTEVTVEESVEELFGVLDRYGASDVSVGRENNGPVIFFTHRECRVQIAMPMPRLSEFEFDRQGRRRDRWEQRDAHEQAEMVRWRVMILNLKARLECIEIGIDSVESAFLPYLMLPGGGTVGDQFVPKLQLERKTLLLGAPT